MFRIDKYLEKKKKISSLKIKASCLIGFVIGAVFSSGIHSCINNYNKDRLYEPIPIYKDINGDGLPDEVYYQIKILKAK